MRNIRAKFTIGFVAIILLAVMMISMFVAISKIQTTKNVILTDWTIGQINESGQYIDSNEHIVTKKFLNCDNMDIKMDDNATVYYNIYFYGSDKNFISMISGNQGDFDNSLQPGGAKYFKVVLTPPQIDGENAKISIIDINNIAKQINIKYGK